MIRIYETGTFSFATNGLGTVQCYKCIETKKAGLAGWWLDCEIPVEYIELIKPGRIILAKTKEKNDQPFRIRDVRMESKRIIVKAHHVVFDAANYIVADSRPTELGCVESAAWCNSAADADSPYTIAGNIAADPQTHYFVRKTLLECWDMLSGFFGALVDAFDWTVAFQAPDLVGSDTGYKVAYGKNLQGYEIEEDWSQVCTRILPVGPGGITLDPPFIDSDVVYSHGPYTKAVSFQIGESESGAQRTEEEIKEILREKAIAYLEENKHPRISYRIKSDVPQELCINDTVHVYAPCFEIAAHVTEYVYDVESRRVKTLVFGNYTATKDKLAAMVASVSDEIAASVESASGGLRLSRYDAQLQRLYTTMANGLGMFVSAVDDGSGGKLYYYHDRPSLEDSHVVYTINSGGFAVSTDGGQTYTAGIDHDGNAVVNVLSAIGLSADWIETGILRVSKGTQEMLYANIDTGEVRIVADSFALSSGETIQSIAQDEAGKATESVTQRVSQLEVSAQGISSTVSSMQSDIETIQNIQDGTVWRTWTVYKSVPETQRPSKDSDGWESYPPEKQDGYCIWSMQMSETVAGVVTKSEPVNMTGMDGRNGEDATLVKIDSSRGNVFKNNQISTDLTVTVYHGASQITNIAQLRNVYGSGAHLRWFWKRMDDDDFREILSTDDRLYNDGFLFVINNDDVDSKVVFDCKVDDGR